MSSNGEGIIKSRDCYTKLVIYFKLHLLDTFCWMCFVTNIIVPVG